MAGVMFYERGITMRKQESLEASLAIITILATLGYIVGETLYLLPGTDAEYNITVHDKWIKGHGGNDQKYLLSDTNRNVYSIEDSCWKWTFDASDRYAYIEKNKSYHINTFGKRSRWFSNYPNAYKIKEVK